MLLFIYNNPSPKLKSPLLQSSPPLQISSPTDRPLPRQSSLLPLLLSPLPPPLPPTPDLLHRLPLLRWPHLFSRRPRLPLQHRLWSSPPPPPTLIVFPNIPNSDLLRVTLRPPILSLSPPRTSPSDATPHLLFDIAASALISPTSATLNPADLLTYLSSFSNLSRTQKLRCPQVLSANQSSRRQSTITDLLLLLCKLILVCLNW